MRIIAIVGVALFMAAVWKGVLLYREGGAFGMHVQQPQAQKAAPLEKPSSPVSKQVNQSSYDILNEEFRGTDEKTWLITDQGEYVKGTMSLRGFVTGVQGRVALITAPDGKKLYIVTNSKREAGRVISAVPLSSSTPTPKIHIADWQRKKSELADQVESEQLAFFKSGGN